MLKTIKPFNTFLEEIAQEYDIPINVALANEYQHWLFLMFKGTKIPMDAFIHDGNDISRDLSVHFLKSYMCREKDLNHYLTMFKVAKYSWPES